MDNFKIGCWATDDPTRIVHLWGHTNSAVQYSGFWKAGVTAVTSGTAYKVPAGKSFYASVIKITCYANGVSTSCRFGHADNAIGYNSVSPTGTVTHVLGLAGSTSTTVPCWSAYHTGTSRTQADIVGLVGPFAAEQYPFYNYTGTATPSMSVHMWGFEE